jgi:hypothetical protein
MLKIDANLDELLLERLILWQSQVMSTTLTISQHSVTVLANSISECVEIWSKVLQITLLVLWSHLLHHVSTLVCWNSVINDVLFQQLFSIAFSLQNWWWFLLKFGHLFLLFFAHWLFLSLC